MMGEFLLYKFYVTALIERLHHDRLCIKCAIRLVRLGRLDFNYKKFNSIIKSFAVNSPKIWSEIANLHCLQ